MATCWACAKEAEGGPFCAACGKIQPARPRDLFSVLGLPRRFHLEEGSIEKAQRDLSRKLHPDKFAKADARERRFAVEQTTQLNEAVKTLKDPVKRAEYLLRTEGFALATDEAGKPGAGQKLPLAFYEEVMEDREALLEAKSTGPEAVQRLAEKVTARRDEVLRVVDECFTAWEAEGARQVLASAVNELAKLRYYARFLDEVEGRPHD
jgi:molecular chaperone HscB